VINLRYQRPQQCHIPLLLSPFAKLAYTATCSPLF